MTEPDQDGPDVAGLLPLLAELPRPQLPPEVAARLDAAIARAVAERVEAEPARTARRPQRASYAPRRPRLRNVALGSAAACVVLVLAVVFALHAGQSSNGSQPSAGAAAKGPQTVLSTAPVTNPVLLTWAASALQNQSGPLHNGQAVRPSFSPLVVPHATTATGPSSDASPSSGTAAGNSGSAGLEEAAAADCLAADPAVQASLASRRLLSSASGEYSGRSAILLVYSNGADDTTAFIVVVAVPCQAPGDSVLTSGVVPR